MICNFCYNIQGVCWSSANVIYVRSFQILEIFLNRKLGAMMSDDIMTNIYD